jgi:hypothetical protein
LYGIFSVIVIIVLLLFIFDPFTVDAINEQGSYTNPRWIKHSYGVFMINTESFDPYSLYFHHTDLFSDLSRNTTSSPSPSSPSSDLFETDEDTQFQDNIGSDLEVEESLDVSNTETNQTSSTSPSSPSSDLFETGEDTQFQSDLESNEQLDSGDEVSFEESEANIGNNTNSSLINP